ncbi:hypothetical protein BAE44_0002158, partial [Dichanthelium oligosanthes]
LTYNIPHEWYCPECQGYANGCPKPSQGGQTALQKPWHGCDKMKERETTKLHLSHSNVVHQINPRSSNKFGNAKVKFISSEEVASLSRERPACVRSRFALRPSKSHQSPPPNTKHPSNLKCTSPSRSDTQVQAQKRYAAASRDQTKNEDRSYFATQQRKVHPASPPSLKQPSNMKSISPSRSETQVQALKRCDAASRDQAKIQDRPDFSVQQSQVRPASPPHVKQLSNMKCISPNRTQMQVHAMKRSSAASHNQAKEIVNADKGEINSEIEDEPREKGTLCASGMGCFHIFDAAANLNLGEFKAQFPSKVSSRVYDIVKMIPNNLQLELLPRMNDWPKSFEASCPVHEDIGLYFFPNEPDGHEKKHSYLLEASNNYVLRAYIDGIKLLIYSSEVLPSDSQCQWFFSLFPFIQEKHL